MPRFLIAFDFIPLKSEFFCADFVGTGGICMKRYLSDYCGLLKLIIVLVVKLIVPRKEFPHEKETPLSLRISQEF